MAAPTLQQIMEGIEARLDTIEGLRVSDIKPGSVDPPMAVVGVPDVTSYHGTFGRGKFQLQPTITILVSKAFDRIGQHALAGYANPTGATSIVAAIEADKTLGGVVDDCIVVDFRPLGQEEVGLIGFFGGVFNLQVIAQGV